MKNRKRVVSLVLGLVMVVTSVVGPFAMGNVGAEPGDISATVDLSATEVAANSTVTVSGDLLVKVDEETKEASWPEGLGESFEVKATFEEKLSGVGVAPIELSGTGSVLKTEKSYSISIDVGDNAGKVFQLKSIEFADSGVTEAITINSTPEFTVKATQNDTPTTPTITEAYIGDNNSVVKGANTNIRVVISDSSEIKDDSVKVQIKKGDNNVGEEISLNRDTVDGTNSFSSAMITAPDTAGTDYTLNVTAKYGDGEGTEITKVESFTVTEGGNNPAPKTPTVTAVFHGKETPYRFERNTDSQLIYVTFGNDEISAIQKVEATIRKVGDSGAVVSGWNGKKLNGESGIAFTESLEIPSDMPLGEYSLTIKTTVKSDEGYENPADVNISFSVTESTPAQFSFSDRRIITAPTSGRTYYEPNRQIEVGIKVSADRGVVTNVKATVVSDGRATLSESNLAAINSSTGEFAGTITTPANPGDYRVVFSASIDNGNTYTGDNTPLVLSVRTQSDEDPEIRATIYSSTQGPATTNGYQVFKQGGTYEITVYSSNRNVSFQDNITATVTSYNSGYVYGPINLNRNGNNVREYISGNINVPAPLGTNDYYVVTIGNGSVSYIIDGQVKNKAITPMPFIVESGRPNLSSLTATYRQSSTSSTEVNRGFLTANNQIAYTAKIANYKDINSVKLTFVSTQNSSSTGQPLTLEVMLSKYGSDGTYTGTYNVTNGNVGYTYKLQKVEMFAGTNGSGNVVATDTSSKAELDFTVGTHSHTYANGWTYNTTHHWHASVCDSNHPGQTYKSGEAAHTFKTTVVKQATATEEGRSTKTCTVCQYTENVAIPKLGSSNALSTTAIENIGKASNGTTVTVTYTNDANAKLTKEVFDALKGTTKTLELYNSTGIIWRFYGGDIAQNAVTKDISLQTSVASLRPNESLENALISQKVGNKTVVVIFPNNGVLPGKATVRVPYTGNSIMSSTLGSRSGLNVYFFNPLEDVTRALESVARNVSVTGDGYIEFAITHNSTYVITNETAPETNNNNPNNNNPNNNNTPNNNENNKPDSNKPDNSNPSNGKPDSNKPDTNSSNNANTNSGNNTTTKPTTTTTVHRVIQAVSPKTGDLGYGIIWIMMFIAGILLVISSLCMTKYEE